MSTPSFTVTCPCCEARLTIDPDLAAVVAHEEPPRKRSVSDIDAAFDVLKSKSAEREERFRREMEARASGQKAKLLDRMFQEGLKKAKDSPDPPIKPIDID
ncbi:MAG: hypothetical protein DMD81_08815 [Candidatus Rokuibacteriota bacterium]|nr:MAG: hypothetical protein DMD81_08815 [Candidatus Rokubacteria bacterium]